MEASTERPQRDMSAAWEGRRRAAADARAARAVAEMRARGLTVLVFDEHDREIYTAPR